MISPKTLAVIELVVQYHRIYQPFLLSLSVILSILLSYGMINCYSMNAINVRQYSTLNNFPKIDWGIATNICSQIQMLTSIFVGFYVVMIMPMDIKTPA